jgi:predicted hotdog family 3-hydroxylacyl-ACP dehydratase
MVQLDRVIALEEMTLKVATRRHQDSLNPLRNEDGQLPITAGIEIAGEAMALHGALTLDSTDAAPRPGMLAQARDLHWSHERLDDDPDEIEITVTLIARTEDSAMYHFEIASPTRPDLMTGRLTVFFPGASS